MAGDSNRVYKGYNIVLYKKEFYPSVVFALLCLKDLCPPRVHSSSGIKRSLAGTVINLFKIMYRLINQPEVLFSSL